MIFQERRKIDMFDPLKLHLSFGKGILGFFKIQLTSVESAGRLNNTRKKSLSPGFRFWTINSYANELEYKSEHATDCGLYRHFILYEIIHLIIIRH